MVKMIPLWKPFEEELEGLSQGDATKEFEREIAAFLGVRYAVATSSGTAALFLALKGFNIGVGDRVVVPDLTAMATVNAVTWSGASPVLADVWRLNCLNMKTVKTDFDAVIPVHFNGRAAEIPKNTIVIEDACQALGSKNGEGHYLGTLGDCGCFSFSPTKTIYTGQGGLLVTNHYWLYDIVKKLRDQGRKGKSEEYTVAGYNFKFTDLQAKVALKQLSSIEKKLNRKKQVYKSYHKQLEPYMNSPWSNGEVIWLPDIYVNSDKREKLQSNLLKEGVSTRKFYPLIHTQKPYWTKEDFLGAEEASETGLWLPSNVSDEEISYICEQIKKFLKVKT